MNGLNPIKNFIIANKYSVDKIKKKSMLLFDPIEFLEVYSRIIFLKVYYSKVYSFVGVSYLHESSSDYNQVE